ncbi:DUF4825 domain-containing protein [Paenibacillus aurantius]|uniref:DUF4825 domain-containing protein n=1 Tax=Paenibacillus aurantius TaxID=2918900 RepID=A0AA96LHC3_9BACL|nr:DUF4825 domain-containing protein [Paenibacillus aurantius]WNQ13313.1 DUF4825 domain-containing protein [Paenibacillus aurantius]
MEYLVNDLQEEQKKAAYQADPLTHDIESILPYRSRYMGDASNLINLFQALPLQQASPTFELKPDTFTAEVSYRVSAGSLVKEQTARALLYNATAAFALIDNLKVLEFQLENSPAYRIERAELEHWYGKDWQGLLDAGHWKDHVQAKLADPSYVSRFEGKVLSPIAA